MAKSLNQFGKSLRDEIHEIAERFNEINKHTREFKKWLLDAKKAVNVIGINLSAGKIRKDGPKKFRYEMRAKLLTILSFYARTNKDLKSFDDEIDKIKDIIQYQQNRNPAYYTRLNTAFSTSFAETKSALERLQEGNNKMVGGFNFLFEAMKESNDPVPPQVLQTLSNLFLQCYDALDNNEYIMQRVMKTILRFYSFNYMLSPFK